MTPYIRSPSPALAGGDRKYLDDELKKIEQAIRDLIVELNKLKASP